MSDFSAAGFTGSASTLGSRRKPLFSPATAQPATADSDLDIGTRFNQFQEDIRGQLGNVTDTAEDIRERGQREYRRSYVADESGNQLPIIEYTDDGGATWIQDANFDYSQPYAALQQLWQASGQVTDFQTWLANNPQFGEILDPSAAISGLGQVRGELQDTAGIGAEALEFAAQSLGFQSGAELQSAFANMQSQLSQGIAGQTGFSDQEQADRSRFIGNIVSQMGRQAGRDADALLGETGSMMRALGNLDSTRRQIVDVQVGFALQGAEQDFMRKQAEYNSLQDRYGMMVQQGLMSQDQYVTQLQNSKALQLQSYAQEISGIIANNQSLQQAYSTDLEGIRTHAQMSYDLINAELGLQEETLAATSEAFEMYMSPLYAQLENEINLLNAMMTEGDQLVMESQIDVNVATAEDLREPEVNPQGAVSDASTTVGLAVMGVGGAMVTAAATGVAVALGPVGWAFLGVGLLFSLLGLL